MYIGRRLKPRPQPVKEAHESLVRVLDLNLQEWTTGGNTPVGNTRRTEEHIRQSPEATQLISNSPRVILPAIDFAHHRAATASSQNASTHMNMSNPGFHSEAHAPRMLQPEPSQCVVPAPQFIDNRPSLRRFQCPHCGHFIQEWWANGSNAYSKPHYNGIATTSNGPLHGTMPSEFHPLRPSW